MKEPLELMLFLIALMFVVVFICRLWSVKAGVVKLDYYELADGKTEPQYVAKASNNLNNLFQLPPIFIAACIVSICLPYTSDQLIFNAWGFVIARFVHTLVHITFNWLLVRSAVFSIGVYFLVAIWIEILSKI
ncbi:MAG TPA: MAPEG family protein [Cellvibrionaceae bacterium]